MNTTYKDINQFIEKVDNDKVAENLALLDGEELQELLNSAIKEILSLRKVKEERDILFQRLALICRNRVLKTLPKKYLNLNEVCLTIDSEKVFMKAIKSHIARITKEHEEYKNEYLQLMLKIKQLENENKILQSSFKEWRNGYMELVGEEKEKVEEETPDEETKLYEATVIKSKLEAIQWLINEDIEKPDEIYSKNLENILDHCLGKFPYNKEEDLPQTLTEVTEY